MSHRWCEDRNRHRLHCFHTDADEVAPGTVALCGWVLEGGAAAALIEMEWRAVSGDRSICHDCNVKWEGVQRAQA
jgi:hypothetical protein